MCLVAAHRLSCTRVEVNSCPPILVTFEHVHDRDTVLAKTASLDKTSGIVVSIYLQTHTGSPKKGVYFQITEDMSRPERVQWGELRKFMNKLSLKQPTSHFFLKNTKLYIDNRQI